jgi:hypothetical protein
VLLGLGTLLFVGSTQARWVRLPDSADSASGSLAWVGVYLVGGTVLGSLAGLAVVAAGPGRRTLRLAGTCLAIALAAFGVAVPMLMAPGNAGPDVGVALGVATSAVYLAALWMPSSPGQPAAARGYRWSLPLWIAGLGLMLVSAYLPWWRTTYADGAQTVDGAIALGRVFPLWLLPVGAAVATHGQARHIAGIVGASLGAVALLACSGLTGTYWFFAATDALATEHGMTGTRPDLGLVVALASIVLLTLGGAVQFIARPRWTRTTGAGPQPYDERNHW